MADGDHDDNHVSDYNVANMAVGRRSPCVRFGVKVGVDNVNIYVVHEKSYQFWCAYVYMCLVKNFKGTGPGAAINIFQFVCVCVCVNYEVNITKHFIVILMFRAAAMII